MAMNNLAIAGNFFLFIEVLNLELLGLQFDPEVSSSLQNVLD